MSAGAFALLILLLVAAPLAFWPPAGIMMMTAYATQPVWSVAVSALTIAAAIFADRRIGGRALGALVLGIHLGSALSFLRWAKLMAA
ncbi:hypothetical protein [Pelagovum pacificum]|uniref:Uncharacterized protein n=1 Tax=Pelagovum pacificum TaxID=2588711 RepID=A0A5C5GB50_9RHOB|nr:hypothetical protein [Pelagovum pacificum]QQA42116.1 hypothetical protein I8N54_15140 [Pelagovum pacificum]TNY31204.1 hypothetical protein FHY64_14325 [Pelagovum pacificum]